MQQKNNNPVRDCVCSILLWYGEANEHWHVRIISDTISLYDQIFANMFNIPFQLYRTYIISI